MSDSDSTSVLTDEVDEETEEELWLADTHSVRLLINVHAEDPRDAVEQFLEKILTFGLRGFTYAVLNTETDEIHYVEDDVVYSTEELNSKYEAEAAEGARIADIDTD